MERLRFVARARGVPGDVLATEATAALTTFVDDPAALVAGCRRVLSRQPGCGPLWWACARLLTASRLREVARETIEELEGDTTGAALSLAIFEDPDPGGDTDAGADGAARPEVVRAHAVGGGSAVVDAADLAAMDPDAEARWLVCGVGVHLSDPMWDALVRHWSAATHGSEELVDLDAFTHFVGPHGPLPLEALGEPDCPVAPELFRLAG